MNLFKRTVSPDLSLTTTNDKCIRNPLNKSPSKSAEKSRALTFRSIRASIRIRRHNAHQQSGTSLLEILVTLVITSIGLLGLAYLQTNVIKGNHDAHSHTVASFLGNEIIERMRSNIPGVRSGSYSRTTMGSAVASSTNCRSVTCSSTQMAGYDIDQWLNARLKVALPSGDATISATSWSPTFGTDPYGNPTGVAVSVTIVIRWKSQVGGNCDSHGGSTDATYSCHRLEAHL